MKQAALFVGLILFKNANSLARDSLARRFCYLGAGRRSRQASRRRPEWRRVGLPADAPSQGSSSAGSKNMRAPQANGKRAGRTAPPIVGRLAAKDVDSHRNATSCAAGVCRRAVHQLPTQADFAVFSGVVGALAGAGGIEPPNDGIKIRCLTAWLRPNRPRGTRQEACPDSLPAPPVYRERWAISTG